MRTTCYLLMLMMIGISANVFGQSAYNVPLPQILPASPTPAEFVKAGSGSVNMSSGALNASIPLYTVKLRDYSFPISLSYNTQGLKADQSSGRVGLGWVLNATGMITRSVKGKPDEFAQRIGSLPPYYDVESDANYYFYQDASSSSTGGDTQPDEFQFNVNGYSGKFVLDSNYVARVTSTSNIKITVAITVTPASTAGSIGLINLTTPDGVKYQFGSAYEITTSCNIMQFNAYKLVTKTAFFLDRIDLPNGDYINFNYTSISNFVNTGTTQTAQFSQSFGNCGNCMSYNTYTTQQDRVDYNTRLLNSIVASNGLTVNFTYEPIPDLSGDKRLKTLEVPGLKKYQLKYYDVAGSSSVITGRYFLTLLQDVKPGFSGADSSYDYKFTYNQLSSVPLTGGFKQDYLGYYNGSPASYFIPPAYNSSGVMDFSFRNPNAIHSIKGTLAKIQYPTGGIEEYFYEANTESHNIKRNTLTTYNLEGNGGGSSGTSYPLTYTNSAITVPRNQTVTLSGYALDALPDDGYTADPAHKTVTVNLYEGTTLLASRAALGYSTTSTTVALQTGHTYKLELVVESYTERGYASLLYDSSDHDIYDIQTTEVPGLRVRKIKHTDSIALSSNSKFFIYTSLDDRARSTGAVSVAVNFRSSSVSKYYCGQHGELETDCVLDIYSSSSTNQVYDYSSSGSVIYYNKVIECDDSLMINGGTEYTYFDNEMGSNYQFLMGQSDIPYLSSGQYPTRSGILSNKRVFDKNKTIVQAQENVYETLNYLGAAPPSFYVRKRYEPYSTRLDRLEAYDLVKSTYTNCWIRQVAQNDTLYSNGVLQATQTKYEYGLTNNILPLATTVINSKGDTIRNEVKYPNDEDPDPMFNSGILSKLSVKNMITIPVLESSYNNGILMQQKATFYKDWYGDSKVLRPEIVKLKASPNDILRPELYFNRYDKLGDPLELQKTGDVKLSYIWDSTHMLPICQVKNADFTQVAYASFEAGNETGNWQITSGAKNTGGRMGGKYGFTGSLSKTVSIPGTYLVTLWTNATATVNGSPGTLILTSNYRNLYSWTLNSPSSVTVTGTNIDEVRLFPAAAQMVTYSYLPFIGASAVFDANNIPTFYEYDSVGRLVLIRNVDNQVLKQYCYHYSGEQENCTIQTFLNVAKSAAFTKSNCSSGTGSSVTYTVPASKYVSTVSQADADQQATNELNASGQAYADTTGTCLSAVPITFQNWAGISGFNIVYTNTSTSVQTTFALPTGTGIQTLGSIAPGTYNISISKAGNTTSYMFTICSSGLVYAPSANFNNISVTASACNFVQIDTD